MKKLVSNSLVLMLVLGLVSVAQAKKDKGTDLKGQITSIDGMKLVVTSGKKKSAITTEITCDEKTTITRDGQAAKPGDLKVGDYVSVTPSTGTATTIVATTTAPAKKSK